MPDVTRILHQIESGDPHAAAELLPLVYEELRSLARSRLAQEKPGQTLQPTALVHEAFLRLVHNQSDQEWDSRGHFFSAAAEAMRRILVDQARKKKSIRHGGSLIQHDLDHVELPAMEISDDCLAVHEALAKFEQRDKLKAELVKLCYFAGFSLAEAADALGISTSSADKYWSYARAWLHNEMRQDFSN